jgi:hypothetical protein
MRVRSSASSRIAIRFAIGMAIVLLLAQAGAADWWRSLFVQPEARSGHGALLDCPNERMMVVAGWGASGYMNDVWALECRHGNPRWAKVNPTGPHPPGRRQYALVCDSQDHALIMFAGIGGRALNDVWALTLAQGAEAWIELSPVGSPPQPREGPAGVYDPLAHRAVFFGGNGASGELNDTWSLDLATLAWTQLYPSGGPPPARWDGRAVYDPVGHRMIVFGGYSQALGCMNDVWALALDEGAESWTHVTTGGPSPEVRRGHAATYDWMHHRMLIYGGWNYPPFNYFNDTWALDLSTHNWSQLQPAGDPPPPCRDQSAVYFHWEGIEGMAVFGGNLADGLDYSWYGDTYILVLE